MVSSMDETDAKIVFVGDVDKASQRRLPAMYFDTRQTIDFVCCADEIFQQDKDTFHA